MPRWSQSGILMFDLILQGNETYKFCMSDDFQKPINATRMLASWCISVFNSIQEEKPVKREQTTKEFSRGNLLKVHRRKMHWCLGGTDRTSNTMESSWKKPSWNSRFVELALFTAQDLNQFCLRKITVLNEMLWALIYQSLWSILTHPFKFEHNIGIQ